MIVIEVEGGLITDVISDDDQDVIILDHDTEGADEDDVVVGDNEAYFSRWQIYASPERIRELANEYTFDIATARLHGEVIERGMDD